MQDPKHIRAHSTVQEDQEDSNNTLEVDAEHFEVYFMDSVSVVDQNDEMVTVASVKSEKIECRQNIYVDKYGNEYVDDI